MEIYSYVFDKMPKALHSPYMISIYSVSIEVTLHHSQNLTKMINIGAVLDRLLSLISFDIYSLP